MIKLNDLAIGYNGEAILEHIDQEFDDGLIYGILAKSGAGKTTLLKTISGLLHPVHGEVVIDGTTYRNADKNPVYMMHQRYSNFGWLSCTENVLIAQRDKKLRSRDDAIKVLAAVGLEQYADKWPSQLSGGMQQRLALARTLYVKPKYLLMDEPLSALGHQHNKGVVNMDVMNVEIANLDDLKKRFVEICATINRPGMEDLMAWLERSDFYTAPASTRFHGNYTGGLLEHSLNVYDKLSGFVARYPELEISPETVAVTALFHDLTKVNYYTVSSRNVKDDVTGAWHKEPFYKTEDRLPLGHGEKSVIILQSFIKLTRDEIVAIRWHMGSFDCAVKGGDYGMGNAFETYPLAVMTHLADMEATYLVEGLAAK